MKSKNKIIFSVFTIFLLLIINGSMSISSLSTTDQDFDPLVDIEVTFNLDTI